MNIKKILSLIIFSLSLIIISLLAVLFVAENYFFDKILYQKSTLHGYVRNKGYDLKPSSFFERQRIKDLIKLHSQNSTPNFKKDDKYTIAIIGDSFAYGVGIRNSQRFSNKIKEKLNNIRPTKVYTFALPGDGLFHYLVNYRLIEKYINPDLYIVTLVENDFMFYALDKYPASNDIFEKLAIDCGNDLFKPSFPGYENNWWTLPWCETVNSYSYPASLHPTNLCFAKKIINNLNQNKTLYLTMSSYQSQSSYSFNANSNECEKQAMTNTSETMMNYVDLIIEAGGNILKIDVFDDSDITDEEIAVSSKEGHYSVTANTFIGEKLIEEIKNNDKWGF